MVVQVSLKNCSDFKLITFTVYTDRSGVQGYERGVIAYCKAKKNICDSLIAVGSR